MWEGREEISLLRAHDHVPSVVHEGCCGGGEEGSNMLITCVLSPRTWIVEWGRAVATHRTIRIAAQNSAPPED